eukprot:COSAG01_NODE_3924_length_5529_cov_1.581584_2_plen_168_part_00
MRACGGIAQPSSMDFRLMIRTTDEMNRNVGDSESLLPVCAHDERGTCRYPGPVRWTCCGRSAVSRAFPILASVHTRLTEIYLCYACSDHDVDYGNALGRPGALQPWAHLAAATGRVAGRTATAHAGVRCVCGQQRGVPAAPAQVCLRALHLTEVPLRFCPFHRWFLP